MSKWIIVKPVEQFTPDGNRFIAWKILQTYPTHFDGHRVLQAIIKEHGIGCKLIQENATGHVFVRSKP